MASESVPVEALLHPPVKDLVEQFEEKALSAQLSIAATPETRAELAERLLEEKDDFSQSERFYINKHRVVKTKAERVEKLSNTFKIIGPKGHIDVKAIKDQLGDFGHLISEFATGKSKEGADDEEEYLDSISFHHLADLIEEKKKLVQGEKFENVNTTFHSFPEKIVSPHDVEEILKIKDAAGKKQRVRVVGCAHSWTPVFPENGSVMISMENFKGMSIDFSGDPNERTCTFKVGEKVKSVDDYLKDNDLCIPTNIVMNHVGFGGLISMGCHGTGWGLKTISDLCVAMKLVDGNGEHRSFSLKEDGPRVWSALLCNLGLCGVVYEYTIKVQKNFNVMVRDYKVQSREYFGEGAEADLRDVVMRHHSTQIFWLPFNDQIWVKTFDETHETFNPEHRRVKYVVDTFSNWFSLNVGVPSVDLATVSSRLVPLFLKAAFETFPNDYLRVETITHAIHWQKFLDTIRINCMELAFRIRPDHLEDWAKLGKCVRYVQQRVYELQLEHQYPLNLSLEMRFIGGSDGLLTSAHGNEQTCFMELVSSHDAPLWKEFSAEVALQWIKIFPGARPHWAKQCQHIPGIVRHIRDQLGDRIPQFLAIRKELNVDQKRCGKA
eukprot:TRINITY_DN1503_c0_g1_i2.p1 TRINITY_DN1503_c0_g1~~TRINITY_DN1503_c0_g1_i2.p1  ORF type:complete len:608 (-),score=159.59 TRINITY_DN1503_c0_g1_i2:104-1927(-)